MPGFDLSAALNTVVDDGIPLPIEYPNGDAVKGNDGEPIVFRIISADDPRYLRVQRQVQDERAAKARGQRGKPLSGAEAQAINIRLVAAAVIGWTDNFDLDGQPCRYSPEMARKVMERVPLIRDQVDIAFNDRERFLLTRSEN